MATNKHAQIRYLALDKCFSNYGRKFNIDDLVEACTRAVHEFTGVEGGVKKRQIYEDIKFMESSQGWSVELQRIREGKKVFFRYANKGFSIINSPLTRDEVSKLRETLLILSRFKGLPQFEWIDEIENGLQKIDITQHQKIVLFEQNQYLKGLEHFTPLFNAILNKRSLEIRYSSFKENREVVWQIHPYILKQYNQRWFLFGLNEAGHRLSNLALDRIVSIQEISCSYIVNSEIDFNDYFEDVVGVTVPTPKIVEEVILTVSSSLWPYINSKPIHGSQKKVESGIDWVTIQLELVVNYELISLLLSYGEKIIVRSPDSLIEIIKAKLNSMIGSY